MEDSYINMLEIPINSCDVVIKPQKRKKKDVKDEVIEKVNKETVSQQVKGDLSTKQRKAPKLKYNNSVKKVKTKPKIIEEVESETVSIKSGKFDIVSVQIVAIFVLIVGIILTNIFWEDSGINNLLKSVFKSEDTTSSLSYSSFNAKSPSKLQNISINNGVITVNSGSIYSPCDGVIESITESGGKKCVTIVHSNSFKSILNGLEYCYLNVGDNVYSNIAVGYSSKNMEVSLYNNDAILTCYAISDNSIVWEV